MRLLRVKCPCPCPCIQWPTWLRGYVKSRSPHGSGRPFLGLCDRGGEEDSTELEQPRLAFGISGTTTSDLREISHSENRSVRRTREILLAPEMEDRKLTLTTGRSVFGLCEKGRKGRLGGPLGYRLFPKIGIVRGHVRSF